MFRRVLAVAAVLVATLLMWSDAAVGVWQAVVAFCLRSNESVTSTVMGVRQWGDADLHVMVWGVVSAFVFFAFPTPRKRLCATVILLAWSGVVELAQPWITQSRSRQWIDFAGNIVGILGVFLVLTLVEKLRGRSRYDSAELISRP